MIAGALGAEAVRVGYVFQSPRLFPWLTVRGNLEVVAGRERDHNLMNTLLPEMGLDLLKQHPQLLGGLVAVAEGAEQ